MKLPKRMFLLGLCAMFFVSSCTQEGKRPQGVLPVNKMSDLLLDLQIAKSYNNSFLPGQDTTYPQDREERLKLFYQQIFQLYDIDTATFFKSYRFYTTHPDRLKKIYDRMQDSLRLKITYHQKIEERQRREKLQEEEISDAVKTFWTGYFEDWHAFFDLLHHQKSRMLSPWQLEEIGKQKPSALGEEK